MDALQVLCVEDQPDQLEIRMFILRKMGYDVFPASNTEAALDIMARNCNGTEKPINVAVVDRNLLSRDDGVQLLRDIHGIDSRVRRILVNGSEKLSEEERALFEDAFDDVWQKPTDPRKWRESIEGLFSKAA